MSTSPIGTRVPTLSPNSIIRAGIPLSDDFNASDVAISVQSLLELVPPSGGGVASVTGTAVDNADPFNPVINSVVSSGTWTQTFSVFSGCVVDATLITAYYSKIDTIVTATINASVDLDFSLGGGVGYIEYTPPIATTTFSPIGLGQLFQESTNCNIASDSSKLYFYSTSSANIGITTVTFSFQYEIN